MGQATGDLQAIWSMTTAHPGHVPIHHFQQEFQMKSNRAITIMLAAFFVCGQAYAQSKIQCHLADDGSYHAALIWQNTLGTERANEICRNHAHAIGLGVSTQHADASQARQTEVKSEVRLRVQESRFDAQTIERARQSVLADVPSPTANAEAAGYAAMW